MNFKQVLVHQDISVNKKDANKFDTWDVVSRKINKNKEKPIEKTSFSEAKYNILCQNDNILYDS